MIDEYDFGRFVVEGKQYFDDIKIVKVKVRIWNMRIRHELRIEDINDLIIEKPEYLVIGTGASGMLNVSNDIKLSLREAGITTIIKKTSEAVKEYNVKIKTIPTSIVAGFYGFTDKPLFEAEKGSEKAPKVNFTS